MAAEKRAVPGIMSFTSSMKLLYINAEAEQLNHQIVSAPTGNGSAGEIPDEVMELCTALQEQLESHTDLKERNKVQLRRTIGDIAVLRGFLIPAPPGEQEGRFLILMEKIGRRRQTPPPEVKTRFHLTDREFEIIGFVADGCTNKQIARQLNISENTVKEHIKHILRKTTATSRTGILAQLYRDI